MSSSITTHIKQITARINSRIQPIIAPINPVIALIKAVWAVCMWEKGPQSLPTSMALVGIALVLNIICVTGSIAFDHPIQVAFFASLSDSLILLMIGTLPLLVMGLRNRIAQTLTAMLGASIIIAIFRLISMGILSISPVSLAELGLLGFLTFPLSFWGVLINAFVIRNALSSGYLPGIILALIHAASNFAIIAILGKLLFPVD